MPSQRVISSLGHIIFYTMSLATLSLFALTLHKGVSVVVIYKAQHEVHFSSVTATFLGEAAKLVVSFAMLQATRYRSSSTQASYVALQQQSSSSKQSEVDNSFDSNDTLVEYETKHTSDQDDFPSSLLSRRSKVLAIVAVFYVVQNNAYLYASSVLAPTVMQAVWQLRIISTAVASAIVLKRRFSVRQIIGMGLLSVSVLLVNESLSTEAFEIKMAQSISSSGIVAALIACVFSGIAGVLVEAELKDETTCMWTVNCQMSLFSLAPALLLVLYEMYCSYGVGVTGFQGFVHLWPWAVVFVHGIAGLLVAFVTKFASTIARSFSGAFAILLTLIISTLVGTRPQPIVPEGKKGYVFFLGIVCLYFSTWLYSFRRESDSKDKSSSGEA